jgi:DNA-binding transcriptional LysR family regulator
MFRELLQVGGLSFDCLQSFCLVAQAGGVTKAAKGDPAKQSLFSRQVKELEEFFGAELMRRKGRGIVLTAAGERLSVLARECFASLLDFKSGCKGLPVEIVIGAGESIIDWVLMPRLAELRQKLPNVRLKFLNLATSEVVR